MRTRDHNRSLKIDSKFFIKRGLSTIFNCHMNILQTTINIQDELQKLQSDTIDIENAVLDYIQVCRLGIEELKTILAIWLPFHDTPYSEVIFVGLIVFLELRPIHYISWLTGRSQEQIQDSLEYAVQFINNKQL